MPATLAVIVLPARAAAELLPGATGLALRPTGDPSGADDRAPAGRPGGSANRSDRSRSARRCRAATASRPRGRNLAVAARQGRLVPIRQPATSTVFVSVLPLRTAAAHRRRLRQLARERAELRPEVDGRPAGKLRGARRARTTSASARTSSPPRRRDSTSRCSSRTRRNRLGQQARHRVAGCDRHRRSAPDRGRRGDRRRNGKVKPIYGMGHHNHENSVAMPGYGKPVVLSGDDSFVSIPAQSQLYSYIARTGTPSGRTRATCGRSSRTHPASTTTTTSRSAPAERHRPVREGAEGRRDRARPDGSELMAADNGYPLPPNDGTWQRDPMASGSTGHSGCSSTGVTRRPSPSSSSRGSRTSPMTGVGACRTSSMSSTAGAARRAPADAFTSTNGRIWRLVLDPKDPTQVLSFSVLIEGDDAPVKPSTRSTSRTTSSRPRRACSSRRIPARASSSPSGRPTQLDHGKDLAVRPRDRHEAGGGQGQSVGRRRPDRRDAAPVGNLGAWESSGIVDASKVFGPGAFLVDVQAGTLVIDEEVARQPHVPA